MKDSTATIRTKSSSNIKTITITAMFAALVTVATAFIKIPSAFGYSHPGDSMVYLAACVLPGPYGIIASSVGGALADLISGYPQWILPTFIIKGINALPFFLCRIILKKKGRDDKIICLPTLLMLIPTTAVTVFGYFTANWLLYDWGGAVAELATWWLQPGMGAAIFILAGAGLDALKFKQKMLPKLLK